MTLDKRLGKALGNLNEPERTGLELMAWKHQTELDRAFLTGSSLEQLGNTRERLRRFGRLAVQLPYVEALADAVGRAERDLLILRLNKNQAEMLASVRIWFMSNFEEPVTYEEYECHIAYLHSLESQLDGLVDARAEEMAHDRIRQFNMSNWFA